MTTVVVGAGHCGLAMSRHLGELGVYHVVLERAEVANAWRTQRWDSLTRSGVRLEGRLAGVRDGVAQLSGDVLDRKGRVRHDGGVVTTSPGLYVIGLPFLRRRKSTLIDGAAADAADIAAHLAGRLADPSTDRPGDAGSRIRPPVRVSRPARE